MNNTRALQWLNFFLADVRDGIGPFLTGYLLVRHHWQPGDIGVAVGISLLMSVLFQTPMGAFIDRSRFKRQAIVVASLLMIVSSIIIVVWPTYLIIMLSQFMMGIASTVFAPAISAITLGIVGYVQLDTQVSRNESYNHGGNVIGALLAALLGNFFHDNWIFYTTAILALLAIISVSQIRESSINHVLARGAINTSTGSSGLRELLTHHQFIIFSFAIVLFHFSNAAMLPLAGQFLSKEYPENSALLTGLCIVLAQLVMVPVARYAGSVAGNGRKPLLIVAFATLCIRGLLYMVSSNAYFIVSIQLLDGLAAGIVGVITILVVADLTKGKGFFNTAQGVILTAVGIGAACSNIIAGYIVQLFNYYAAFSLLAAIAAIALFMIIIGFKESIDRSTDSACV